MRKQRSPWTKKQQLIFGIIVIVVTLIASVTAILIVATKPYVCLLYTSEKTKEQIKNGELKPTDGLSK